MSDSEYEVDPGLDDVDVVTKYKTAGEMANKVVKEVKSKAVSGANVFDLCRTGDDMIIEMTSKVYNKKVDGRPILKGIAFPTCISVNNCICHFSPVASDQPLILNAGDVVKIDLGVHIDGYIAVVASTHVVDATAEAPISGRKADVLLAAHNALEACVRMIKPGVNSETITETISKIAADFECTPVQDMLSHQFARHIIDGEKTIVQNPSDDVKKEHKHCDFELHEAYGVDIIMSTGEGKARPGEEKTNVYRKTETMYSLKYNASRHFLSEVLRTSGHMPFSLRGFEDESRARMGVKECVDHQVLQPYATLYERDGEFVAQFRALLLVMPNGNVKVTTADFDTATVQSEHQVTDEEIQKVLATSLSSKKKKKKNKKKAAQATA